MAKVIRYVIKLSEHAGAAQDARDNDSGVDVQTPAENAADGDSGDSSAILAAPATAENAPPTALRSDAYLLENVTCRCDGPPITRDSQGAYCCVHKKFTANRHLKYQYGDKVPVTPQAQGQGELGLPTLQRIINGAIVSAEFEKNAAGKVFSSTTDPRTVTYHSTLRITPKDVPQTWEGAKVQCERSALYFMWMLIKGVHAIELATHVMFVETTRAATLERASYAQNEGKWPVASIAYTCAECWEYTAFCTCDANDGRVGA